jgi:hypothetical protein
MVAVFRCGRVGLGEMFEWALYLGVQILPGVNSASDLLGLDYAPAP